MSRPFTQVDVFGAAPYRGNPVAVVADAESLRDSEMQRFASWTNLSETTFLLPTTTDAADYRVRIFTPTRELPFAGHPTLGTAHAWLAAGGTPARADAIVQECAVGLVTVRRGDEGLAFAAPPLMRTGDVAEDLRQTLVRGLGLRPSDVVGMQWVDNGPGWVGVQLRSAGTVLAVEPDVAVLDGLNVGIVGAHTAGAPEAFEVRALASGGVEDPVTGSLNAGLAQWLIGSGQAPSRYRARQGTRLGRYGVVSVEQLGDDIWVGGATVTCVTGTVDL